LFEQRGAQPSRCCNWYITNHYHCDSVLEVDPDHVYTGDLSTTYPRFGGSHHRDESAGSRTIRVRDRCEELQEGREQKDALRSVEACAPSRLEKRIALKLHRTAAAAA